MANRFWVGGSATWDATAGTKWATTTGGAGGSAVPTAADDVFLDNGVGHGSVTLSASSVCRSLNCTGYVDTLTHPAATDVNIGDATAGASSIALKLVAGMTYTKGDVATSRFVLKSTSATVQTIDSGGKTMGNIQFNGVGGSWQLAANFTNDATATVNLTNGTLDTNGKTCSWGKYAMSTGTRTLTLGASAITFTGATTTAADFNTNNTNFTLNAGTSTITIGVNNSGIVPGNQTFNNIVPFAGTTTFGTGNMTCANFTADLTGTPGSAFLYIWSGNLTVTGTLTLKCVDSGINGAQGYFGQSVPMGGVQRTVTAAVVALQNVDFSDINAQGASIPWTGTNFGDGGGNANITFAASRTLYWVGSAGTWATLNRWATSTGGVTGNHPPMAHDDVILDANSALGVGGTMGASRVIGRNVDFSAASNTFTWNDGLNPMVVNGNFVAKSGMTISGTGQLAFAGRGTQTVDYTGVTSTITGVTQFSLGSYSFLSNVTLIGSLQHNSGTLNFNGFNVVCPILASNNNNTRTLNLGSGTTTLNGTGTVFNCATVTGLTLIGSAATILVTDASVTAKAFEHRIGTLGTVVFTGGGTGTVTFGGSGGAGVSPHYGTLTLGAPKTYIFNTAATSVIIDTAFNAVGSAGNIITIQSNSGGVQAVLSKASGIVSCDYLSLTDSNATGGASWYAGANSTNVSNNSGWIFSAPSGGNNMLLMGV